MTFEQWLRKVDAVYTSVIGLGMDDLGDAPWYDYFEMGFEPREAAAHALTDWQDMEYGLIDDLGLGGLV